MNRRGRSRKPTTKKLNSSDLSDLSLNGPLASSSPTSFARSKSKKKSKSEDNEYGKYVMEHGFEPYRQMCFNEVDAFIKMMSPDILDLDITTATAFGKLLMESLKENDGKDGLIMDTGAGTSKEGFKAPLGVPKTKDTGDRKHNGNSPRRVHWDLTSKMSGNDDDVFKTPFVKKGFKSKVNEEAIKNPSVPQKETLPAKASGSLSKNVLIRRIPLDGEPAVSLSGSPLLVMPFKPEYCLTVPFENGKVMSILPPDNPSTEDKEAFTQMTSDTKEQIKALATYLLNNVKE